MHVLVEKWLEHQEYRLGLETLRLLAPQHLLLDRIEEEGNSTVGNRLLYHALTNLPDDPVPPEDDLPPVAEDLYREQKRLLQKRSRTHNRYHDCTTDIERGAVHRELVRLQLNINNVSRRLEYYEQAGEMPPTPPGQTTAGTDDLPQTAYEQLALRNKIVKRISYRRRCIRELENKRGHAEELARHQSELNRLVTLRDLLTELLKKHG